MEIKIDSIDFRSEAEKLVGELLGVQGKFFKRLAAEGRECCRGMTDESGFIALSTVGFGREVGRIGLDHEMSRWALFRGCANLLCTFEGGDSAEWNDTAES